MTERDKFKAGYEFAQQESAALAGVIHDPPDPGAVKLDPAWHRGYELFHSEQEQAP